MAQIETDIRAAVDDTASGVAPETSPVKSRSRRTWAILLGVSSYALELPRFFAKPLLRNSLVQWTGQQAAYRLAALFDAAVALALARLQDSAALQSFVESTLEHQLGSPGNDRAITALVRAQVEQTIAAFTEDPALLHPLVQAAADAYLESLHDDPALVNAFVQRVATDYLTFLTVQPQAVHDLTQVAADAYLAHIRAHPEVADPLVEQAALRLLIQLHAEPEPLHRLVEIVGDRYITYLRANPEGVRAILQGQKETLTTEIMGEVRGRSASADQTLENLIRSLLGGGSRRGPGSQDLASGGSR